MPWADYKKDLLSPTFDPHRILDQYFHTGQPVVFANTPREVEPKFKRKLAGDLQSIFGAQLHPLQLILCRSAHLGFSPVPGKNKLGRVFDPAKSDIDVAVVSAELFDSWWLDLQSCGLDQSARDEISEDIFWGFISPDNVGSNSRFKRKWWKLFGDFETDYANGVRGRLYRSYGAMQNYHLHAINGGRRELLGDRA
ncbi:MAG: hypothetical protein ACJ8C4_13845 [Gemmataceae bacterium]